MVEYTPDFLAWFWARIDCTNGLFACWNWTAGKNSQGYGQLTKNGHFLKAHRVSYELAYGKSPGDLCVLHSCDNPSCCNPSHLFLGTRLDNNRDRDMKGRGVQRRGEQHGNHKLTDAQVAEIRRLYASESMTQTELARLFGVHQTLISLIVKYKARL